MWGILSIDALEENKSCLRVLQHALHWESGRRAEGGLFAGPGHGALRGFREAAVESVLAGV